MKIGKDENQSISTSGILKSPESTNDKYMMTTSSHFILNMSNPSWYYWTNYDYYLGMRIIKHIEIIYGQIQRH